jgi:hypothetical protein
LRLFAGDVVVNDLLVRSGETYALQISGACAARRAWPCLSQGEGIDRRQSTLFPEYLEDWIDENNPVQVIDAFVDELALGELGFGRVAPEQPAAPTYHPSDSPRRLWL